MRDSVWPPDRMALSEPEVRELEGHCRARFEAKCRDLRLDAGHCRRLAGFYLPWAAWLAQRQRRVRNTLVAGLCGAQGSGKSTMAALLGAVLEAAFDVRVATFSIDDIYKTRKDRLALARRVHPLFATRGVPGTHDVGLGTATIERLRAQGPGQSVALPSFDKSTDTRRPRAEWPRHAGPADLVILEGWCVGARPQAEAELMAPVNALEADEDPEGIWRGRVNAALAGEYQDLFGLLDVLVLLEVSGMQRVFAWRRHQERELARDAASAGDPAGRGIMSDAQVERFVMHYERLTRHILEEMPRRADLVIALDDANDPVRVRFPGASNSPGMDT